MHLNCPHCRNPIEIVHLDPRAEIACPSCGSSFSLEQVSTTGHTAQAGQTIGRFEIIETIGRGASGIVYKARDPELDRVVAIKIPRAGNLAGTQELDRFLREARTAAQLRHPSIVPVHEVGQTDGVPYLVSDFIQGVTLADFLSARRPSFREAAELAAVVAEALHFAHQHQVVHRDVKPSNIMIGGDGKPWVMDFGLAKREAGEITMTVEGQVLGTPAYMPPEQARGEGHTVDARGDVYSLGVVLYQLLTGEVPFRGTQRMLLHQVLHDKPRPPRSLNDHIPRDLETISLKAMAKEPSRRYATAKDLADDLQRWLKGEPILARPVGRAARLWRWSRRNPAVAGLAVAVAVSLLMGTCVSSALAWYAQQKANDEAAAREQADIDRQKAQDSADEAMENLYIAHSNLALNAAVDGNLPHAKQLLENSLPRGARDRDLRGFEWHLMSRRCNEELRTLGHPDFVSAADLSPDSRKLATCCQDGQIRIWDSAEGKILLNVSAPEKQYHLAFSPDGKRLASSSGEKAIRIWDTQTGAPLKTIELGSASLLRLLFSRNGKTLFAGNGVLNEQTGWYEGEILRWDLDKGGPAEKVFEAPVSLIDWTLSPDDSLLGVSVSNSNLNVQVVNVNTKQVQQVFKVENGLLGALAFHPSKPYLACSSREGPVRIWDIPTGRQAAELANITEGAANRQYRHISNRLAFSPDGSQLAAGSTTGTVQIWDWSRGVSIRDCFGDSSSIHSLQFSPDGRRLVSAGYEKTVRIWETYTEPGLRRSPGDDRFLTRLAFSPDNKQMVSASGRNLTLWDVRTFQQLHGCQGHKESVQCVAFSPDGKWLLSGAGNPAYQDEHGEVKLWDAATGKEVKTFLGHKGGVLGAAFSPDSSLIATASADKTVRVWDVTTGQTIREPIEHKSRVRCVAYHPGGSRIASGDDEGNVVVTPLTGDNTPSILRGHGGQIQDVRFSHDGRLLASASSDKTIKFWDADSGEEVRTLRGHNHPVEGIAFSPDGRRLASGSMDCSIKLWDVKTGQELSTIRQHTGNVCAVAFSPDGLWMASGSRDNSVRIHDGRPLTQEVRQDLEALGLIHFLLAKPMLREEMIAAVRKDSTISEATRQTALELAPRFRENANRLNDASWEMVRSPNRNVKEYLEALRWMEVAVRLEPEDAYYLGTYGAALYRMKRYEDTLAALKRVEPIGARRDGTHPATLGFMAMTFHQLKRTEEARQLLGRVRSLLKQPRWAADKDANAIVAEAEALFGDNQPVPKRN